MFGDEIPCGAKSVVVTMRDSTLTLFRLVRGIPIRKGIPAKKRHQIAYAH